MNTYRILWIDRRDKNGIAVDTEGNEYYIFSNLSPGYITGGTEIKAVAFSCSLNRASAVLCLKDIEVVNALS